MKITGNEVKTRLTRRMYLKVSRQLSNDIRVVVKICSLPIIIYLIPKECKCPHNVLVEEIGNHFCDSAIRQSSMHQDQSTQKSELANGIIGTHDSLSSLLTGNTNTNVRFLNHGDIICTISN